MKTTEVLIRDKNQKVSVKINDNLDYKIPKAVTDKWQKLLDIVSETTKIHTVLVKELLEDSLIVIAKNSDKENSFELGEREPLLKGSFCETTIALNTEFCVKNFQQDKTSSHFLNYLGLPLSWPNGVVFGTISLMDDKIIKLSNNQLFAQFRDLIESDLKLIQSNCNNLKLKSELEESNKKNNYFLSTLSRDLRNPLLGIMGLVELNMMKSFEDKELSSDFQMIKNSTDYLKAVIDNVLDFGFIDYEDFEFDRALVSVQDLFNQVVAMNKFIFEHKAQKFLDNHEDLPDRNIYVDRMRFVQIASNILTLASKSCIEGGSISLEVKEIDVKRDEITYNICVQNKNIVNDTSPDKMKESRPLATNIHRANANSADNHLITTLVKNMGGNIKVIETPQSNTKYCMNVTFKYEEENYKEREVPHLGDRKAIVVENNEVSIIILKRMLERVGINPVIVNNGKEAISLYQNTEKGEYEIIITDENLPFMSGFELTSKIRDLNKPGSKSIPIVVICDKLSQNNRKKANFLGASSIITKPISEKRLHKLLNSLLNKAF